MLKNAQVIDDRVVKVDSFLNHQIDIELFNEIGKEFHRRFKNNGVTKIFTIESSGIAIACVTAQNFNVPVVFAKKQEASNMDEAVYTSEVYSFTKDKTYNVRVSKQFLKCDDRVLIIDDFLANGNALNGLLEIIEKAGAQVAGVGIVIEKLFQGGRKVLNGRDIQLESLVIIKELDNGEIIFG